MSDQDFNPESVAYYFDSEIHDSFAKQKQSQKFARWSLLRQKLTLLSDEEGEEIFSVVDGMMAAFLQKKREKDEASQTSSSQKLSPRQQRQLAKR